MSEGKKTGLFLGVAVVVAGLAAFVAWPRSTQTTDEYAGRMLFEQFKDPLAAASMKIMTFDEAQGKLDTFEVRRDRETDQWTIPSRDGYPADAMEQMKVAANSLVGVKILDVQTSNAEDHDDLGVIEPKMETLEVGDEGVGRLVTLKNEKQETLASLIIGDPVKGDETKRYVRIPSQDPVYVVKFDDASLTTKFIDWIEDDLLKLSSIDINQVEIKDYTATLGQQGIALSRKYAATLHQEGTDWTLGKLLEYDPQDPRVAPKEVEIAEGEELNETKLNEMKNALDDLKIVGVYRKPDGVSETLKASADLLSNDNAIRSLAQRGFYPIDVGPDGQAEILSANGEMSVSLESGVKYMLRFGNIAGLSEEEDEDASDDEEGDAPKKAGGVNRYLFVTTMVDQSKFPAPDLKSVPQTLEELDAMLNPPKEEEPKQEEPKPAAQKEEMTPEEPAEAEEKESTTPEKEAVKDAEPMDKPTESQKAAEKESPQPEADVTEGETEASGEGEATGTGQAQDESEPKDEEAKTPPAVEPEPEAPQDTEDSTEDSGDEMTDEERQEHLEAEQEKITKSNQRLLDTRKDKLEEAGKKVRELNQRFADWYYVIPETTYTQLRISRDDLFKGDSKDTPANAPGSAAGLPGGPQLQIPGFPGSP